VKVSVNVTAVPFATATKPASEGLPVDAKETQLDTPMAAAQAGLVSMFWVGLEVLFVVVVAELTIGTLSAFATRNTPLNRNKNVSRFIILFFPKGLSLVTRVSLLLSAL
jgi:hypothetical protein